MSVTNVNPLLSRKIMWYEHLKQPLIGPQPYDRIRIQNALVCISSKLEGKGKGMKRAFTENLPVT